MRRPLGFALGVCIAAISLPAQEITFTPSIGPIPDIVVGDLTPPDHIFINDPFTRGDSLEGLAGEAPQTFVFPNAINIFYLVEDSPSGVPGFTSDEDLIYGFVATPISPESTNAIGEQRISINGQRITTDDLIDLSALVAADPELSFRDEAFSVDGDATPIAPVGSLTYSFTNTATPPWIEITRDLIDTNVLTLEVTNNQGISGSDEFFVYTVSDGPDALLPPSFPPPTQQPLDQWTYNGHATSLSALGPDFPGDTSAFGYQRPDDDGSVVNLGLYAGRVGGDFFHWFQSPLCDLEFVDGATYHLEWRVTSTMVGEANPLLRLRWGYGPFGNLGGGSMRADAPVAPPTASGETYHMIFDQLDVATANAVMDLSQWDPDIPPVPENGITLFFESIDLDWMGDTHGAGGGAVELDDLTIVQFDRAEILSQSTLESEITGASPPELWGEVGFNFSGGDPITVTPSEDGFAITAPAETPSGSYSVYGNPLALSDQGVGFVPFVPMETSGRCYRFTVDVDASANSTFPGSTLPKVNLQLATFSGFIGSQLFTVETDVTSTRAAVFGAPGGLNPAMDDADEQYTAYLHFPDGYTLDGSFRPGLGDQILANIRLQDDSNVLGGSIFVSNLQIHSFPEDLIP